MKNHGLFPAVIAACLAMASLATGCKDNTESGSDLTVTLDSPETVAISETGGYVDVGVEANALWYVYLPDDSKSWLSASPDSGEGTVTVRLTAARCDDAPREATVKFVMRDGTYSQVLITQEEVKILHPISEVRALKSRILPGNTTYTIPDSWKITGRVVSDYTTGHLEGNQLAVQDGTDASCGIMINLTGATSHTFARGDMVNVVVKNGTLTLDGGRMFIAVEAAAVTKSDDANAPMAAVAVVPSALPDYESMYVAVVGSQVKNSSLSLPKLNDGSNPLIGMEAMGSDLDFAMFVRAGASFSGNPVPQGNGTLKGLAAIGATGQVRPTAASDLATMTGERYVAPMSFVPLTVTGSYFTGQPVTGTVTLSYDKADIGNNYSYSITLAGGAAAGLSVTQNPITGQFTSVSGNIVFNITGTPTVAGLLDVSISGTGMSNPIVTTIDVIVPEPPKPYTVASWIYTSAPTSAAPSPPGGYLMPVISSSTATDASTDATLYTTGRVADLNTYKNFGGTQGTFIADSWQQNAAWVMKMPLKSPIAAGGVLNVQFLLFAPSGQGGSPKNWQVEVSSDNVNWAAVGALAISVVNSPTQIERTYTFPAKVEKGTLYVRARVEGTTAANNAAAIVTTNTTCFGNPTVKIQ